MMLNIQEYRSLSFVKLNLFALMLNDEEKVLGFLSELLVMSGKTGNLKIVS